MEEVLEMLRGEGGHEVESRESGVEGGGRGLFVRAGKVEEGGVVTLYPGVVLDATGLMMMSLSPDASKGEYLLGVRTGGEAYTIDGGAFGGEESALRVWESVAGRAGSRCDPQGDHGHALGYLANHSGESANVRIVPVWYEKDAVEASGGGWENVPNVMFSAGGGERVLGAAMVAIRAIEEGEEVLLHYGFGEEAAARCREWYRA